MRYYIFSYFCKKQRCVFMVIEKIQEIVKRFLHNNNYFQNFITLVIIIAGILAGIQTNYEINEQYRNYFHIADIIIISIFILEMFIYMLEHGRRPWRYFREAWHIFDFSIIVISLIPFFFPNSNTEFVVVFRLARILRLARIFEKIKKLKLILHTLFRIIPSMVYVVILLVLLFYVFGVITTDLFGKYAVEEFGSLWTSMKTLFFISFEGWSWLYDSEGIQSLLSNGFPEWIFVSIFIGFQFIAALIFLNLFIGIITSDMESVREDEKRGKSKIYSSGHTLILGWSDKIFSIISELREANDSKEKAEIVILAEKDKNEMDFIIKEKFEGFSTTKVKTRNGNMAHIEDLILVNAWQSKSIIILNDGEPGSDYLVLKAIIALLNHIEDNSVFHIVAEINDPEVLNIARTIDSNNRLIIFDSNDFISRLIAQATLNPNISKVYTEILGFQGSEFYIQDIEKQLLGTAYKDALYKYEESCVVGIINTENCILNPLPNYILQSDDKLIILAEDDSTIKFNPTLKPYIKYDLLNEPSEHIFHSHNILILGYSDKLFSVLLNFNSYLKSESILRIIVSKEVEANKIYEFLKNQSDAQFDNQNNHKCKFGYCNIEIIIIEQTTNLNLEQHLFNIETIIVLANSERFSNIDEIDTNTLVNLLFLKEIENNSKLKFAVIAEILDDNNREIVKNKYITDFIISSNIVGPVLAQLSEERELKKVLDVLFTSEGSEIYVRDAGNYVKLGEKVNFATIVESAIQRNETAIGIIKVKENQTENEFILNPRKSQDFFLNENDKIIVLADED